MTYVRVGSSGLAALALLLPLTLGCASFRAARLYQTGSLALDRGDVVQAIGALERAAELAPDASEIQNHLGLAYQAAGRHDAALRAFRRAVALDCSNQPAAHNLALAERHRAP
jgi:Flp pilus assembly protein TadD